MRFNQATRPQMIIASSVLLIVACVCSSSGSTPTVISTPTILENNAVEQPTMEQATAEQPTPVPETAIGKVGETVTQGAYSITVANVETATTYGEFNSAEAGNKFVAVELVIQSGAATGVSVNPFYVSLKDSNGYEYTVSIFGKEPSLKSQNDLPSGEFVRGWVTFEVPDGASGFILTYDPLSFDNIKIRFDLGQ